MAELLSVSDARQRLSTSFEPVSAADEGLESCLGRILAEDIVAGLDLPPFDNSSMDGFAVRAADVAGSTRERPVRLAVVGDIPAGPAPALSIGSGQCARIMTGAALPAGADAVVPVEDSDVADRSSDSPLPETVQIYRPAPEGAFVRSRGQDLARGQTVLRRGQRLRAQDLGLLAMLGFSRVAVHRLPRVALLSTGDELVQPGEPLQPGQIYESNSLALGALIRLSGGAVLTLGIVRDEFEVVQRRLDQAVEAGVDLILSSAGVSVGAYDYVRAVIEKHGRLEFWRVNIRPGKPLAFGFYRGVPILGLPGNPVSAFVTFEVFVRPLIGRLAGAGETLRPLVPVVLEDEITSDGRESYLRAIVSQRDGQRFAHLTGHQGSGNLYSLVQANALLIIPSGVKSLPAKSITNAWLLDE